MTTSGGHRITVQTDGRRADVTVSPCFLLCFSFFSCMRTLTSELDFLTHVWLKFLLSEKDSCSLTLKLGSGAMATMAGTSSEHRENPHVSDEELKQDQSAVKPIDIKGIERPDKCDNQGAKFNTWFDKFKDLLMSRSGNWEKLLGLSAMPTSCFQVATIFQGICEHMTLHSRCISRLLLHGRESSRFGVFSYLVFSTNGPRRASTMNLVFECPQLIQSLPSTFLCFFLHVLNLTLNLVFVFLFFGRTGHLALSSSTVFKKKSSIVWQQQQADMQPACDSRRSVYSLDPRKRSRQGRSHGAALHVGKSAGQYRQGNPKLCCTCVVTRVASMRTWLLSKQQVMEVVRELNGTAMAISLCRDCQTTRGEDGSPPQFRRLRDRQHDEKLQIKKSQTLRLGIWQ